MNRFFVTSTALACAATCIYTARCYNQISCIPLSQITSSDTVSRKLKTSKAAALTNPNKHVAIDDSRCITIKLLKPLSDEEILARFVKGSFGGWWFGPERAALKVFSKILVNFEELKNVPVSKTIWSITELSTSEAPSLDVILFGAFRVVDRHIADAKGGSQSYIDIAFGSDNGLLAGVHRFSVYRDQPEESQDLVRIEFAHTGCNPREDKPMRPAFLKTLHSWYAMVLFREGVSEVVRAQR